MVDAALELPEEAALYTITLKVARSDGECPESWVRDRSSGGPPPIRVWFGYGYPVPMTRLIAGSGFVGIVDLRPGPGRDGSCYGLRAYNSWIQIQVAPWSAKQDEPPARLNPLVFGGSFD